MKYLDPKNDLTFKKLFGEHADLTISLLNALLDFDDSNKIETLIFSDPQLVPDNPVSKYTIVDVRCTDVQGRQFIIEMQMLWTTGFQSRMLFNACKRYVRQLGRGKEYIGLKPVYSLSLVNENFLKDERDYYHPYTLIHKNNNKLKMKGLEFVFIELKKFKEQYLENEKFKELWANHKKEHILWLRFLTEIDEETRKASKDLLKYKDTKKALELLEHSAFTEEEMLVYDKYWDSISTERTFRAEEEERRKKFEVELEEKKQLIAEKTQQIAEKTQQIEEKTQQIEEQGRLIKEEKQRAEKAITREKEALANAKAAKEQLVQTICNMKKSGLTNEQIANFTKESIEFIKRIECRKN
jgi:predicted transposase/invertase (TIGR01784 family)